MNWQSLCVGCRLLERRAKRTLELGLELGGVAGASMAWLQGAREC